MLCSVLGQTVDTQVHPSSNMLEIDRRGISKALLRFKNRVSATTQSNRNRSFNKGGINKGGINQEALRSYIARVATLVCFATAKMTQLRLSCQIHRAGLRSGSMWYHI